MSFKFLAGLVLVISSAAQASIDVTCEGRGCLTDGWRVENVHTGDFSDVMCIHGDCEKNGWREIHRGRVVVEVICIEQDCFKNGWETYDPRASQPAFTVVCSSARRGQSPDCYKGGWETYNQAGYWVSTTTCVQGECDRWGWDVRYANQQPRMARCKAPGCFETGWTLRP